MIYNAAAIILMMNAARRSGGGGYYGSGGGSDDESAGCLAAALGVGVVALGIGAVLFASRPDKKEAVVEPNEDASAVMYEVVPRAEFMEAHRVLNTAFGSAERLLKVVQEAQGVVGQVKDKDMVLFKLAGSDLKNALSTLDEIVCNNPTPEMSLAVQIVKPGLEELQSHLDSSSEISKAAFDRISIGVQHIPGVLAQMR